MPALSVPPGALGIVALHELPDPAWQSRWDRIFVPEGLKDRLLNLVLFSLRNRGAIDPVRLPIHGLLVLAGPPGTGKTTLALGLADRAAREIEHGPLLLVEIDPHSFPSQMLGESQRAVARLFERTLPDLASRGQPTIVLLDEVEALAVSRAGASLETNPVDVHRATDAVLAGLDQVARTCPNVTFLATTNHIAGVDPAFLSRADLIEQVGLPGIEAVTQILRDALSALIPVEGLDGALTDIASECVAAGADGRQIRKLILRAVTSRRELVAAPKTLRLEDVRAAMRS